jgi:hypothetical protein
MPQHCRTDAASGSRVGACGTALNKRRRGRVTLGATLRRDALRQTRRRNARNAPPTGSSAAGPAAPASNHARTGTAHWGGNTRANKQTNKRAGASASGALRSRASHPAELTGACMRTHGLSKHQL